MDDTELWQLFITSVFADIHEADEFWRKKPYLAHYTSLNVLESILKNEEIWFSNPMFMNDLEEVRFGILHGTAALIENKEVRSALKTDGRNKLFQDSLDHYTEKFEQEHLLDTYVFCLSEQERDNRDGLLSMWRGYGGNGKGAAIVFDTSQLGQIKSSPFILSKVKYGSEEERLAWLEEIASALAKILRNNAIPDDKIYFAGKAVFERIMVFALFTKHHGFKEEKEWRIVYLRERDLDDKLSSMRVYLNGRRGVEPQLRFKIAPIEGVTPPDLSLNKFLSAILLGPTTSSLLAVRSVERMLEVIGKPELKNRLFASSIPLRPT